MKQREILNAAGKYSDKLTKEGTLKETYFLGNMKGAMLIYELNSPEDLVRIAHENPLFPFVDREITPLVDMDAVRKVQAKK